MMAPRATPTRFVILCLGRTGSTHLWSLLDSHPRIRCFGELLNDTDDAEPEAFVHSDETDVVAHLDAVLSEPSPEMTDAVGLKLPMNSLRAHPAAAAFVRRPAMRVLRLRRPNHLDMLVSRRLMAATDVAHSIYGEYGDATVEIPVPEALTALERIEAEEAELDGIAVPAAAAGHVFDLDYDDLGNEGAIENVQRFLGVEPAPLRSWFTRLRTRPLPETVSNWDELAPALKEAGYGRFLPA